MLEYRSITDRIRADAPRKILDWGCGYGQISDMLSRVGLVVSSFDYRPDHEAAVVPLERFPHLSAFVSPDPRRLPFDDAAFDAVLSCGVLEHVEDPDASLEEIRRVLDSDGTFYVYKLPNRTSYLEAIARRTGMYYHGACRHDRVYTLGSAVALLARHDFKVIEARRMNLLPLTLTGDVANRLAGPIWTANRLLSTVPGLNMLATNVELVARVTPRSPSTPPPGSFEATAGTHASQTTRRSSA